MEIRGIAVHFETTVDGNYNSIAFSLTGLMETSDVYACIGPFGELKTGYIGERHGSVDLDNELLVNAFILKISCKFYTCHFNIKYQSGKRFLFTKKNTRGVRQRSKLIAAKVKCQTTRFVFWKKTDCN